MVLEIPLQERVSVVRRGAGSQVGCEVDHSTMYTPGQLTVLYINTF